jgi:NAD(P)-dependent dehydrogenase (short-subunit alcohol dehydrogenase family)
MAQISLVTGANSGIGFEVVRALARNGMTVYLGSRDAEKGKLAAAELSAEGNVQFVRIDFDAPDTLTKAASRIAEAHGKLNVLVNNAGVALPGTPFDASPEVVLQSYNTNLHAPMRLTQLLLPLLRKARDGARIVNVSSAAGQMAFLRGEKWAGPVGQLPYAYCTAKAALNAATVMWAAALRDDGISVNACNPGHVKTRVSAFRGTKSPAEGAEIIVKLATGDDGGRSGAFFDADGSLLEW